MKIYTYKGCGTCKKASQWLDARGIAYQEVPIRETPPSVSELKRMLKFQQGEVRKLFNTAGGDYREMNMKEKLPAMREQQVFELLASRGNLVKRPFLIADDFGLVGFKPDVWAAVFSA